MKLEKEYYPYNAKFDVIQMILKMLQGVGKYRNKLKKIKFKKCIIEELILELCMSLKGAWDLKSRKGSDHHYFFVLD